MPGQSQLVQFNKDILSLGNEVSLRAARGERPVRVQIPANIPDEDDSEEFIMGMPEKEAVVPDTSVDDDLSDLAEITGMGAAKSDDSTAKKEEAPSFEAPDLSSLLAPMDDGPSDGGDMPDLSMFDEPEPEEEEAEPEPPSIADLSLDDLLSGAGFDGSEGGVHEAEQQKSAVADLDEEFYSGGFGDENYVPEKKDRTKKKAPEPVSEEVLDLDSFDEPDTLDKAPFAGAGDAMSLDELGLEKAEPLENADSTLPLDDIEPLEDAEPLEDIEPLEDADTLSATNQTDNLDDFNLADVADIEEDEAGLDNFGEVTGKDFSQADTDGLDELGLEDLDSGEEPPELTEGFGSDFGAIPAADGLDSIDSLDNLDSIDDIGDLDINEPLEPATDSSTDIADLGAGAESFNLDDKGADSLGADTLGLDDLDSLSSDIGGAGDLGGDLGADSLGTGGGDDSFSLDDLDFGDTSTGDASTGDASTGGGLDDLAGGIPDGLFDTSDLDNPPSGADVADLGADSLGADTFGLDDLDSGAGDLGGDLGAGTDSLGTGGGDDSFSLDDLDFGDTSTGDASTGDGLDDLAGGIPDGLFDTSDLDNPPSGADVAFDADIEDFDTGLDLDVSSDDAPIEDFDTSAMDGMTFDISETDSMMGGNEFDLGSNDDFEIEGSEFEIPGFSDVETAKLDKRSESSIKIGKQGHEELPDNTLSDEQYKIFLKNLSEYPLNVRLAFEDLIVRDEFTEDAEFEVVEKILNHAPARQVATFLEKMLDISIPVPRDYEHRTAEEYEAYKKSLSYQLKNIIVPALFVGAVCLMVGFGIFQFAKHCIYIPAKASSLYKQGYTLLQADEYPQSEIKFNAATEYKLNKKWFFQYARGYREHKQYIRAEKMYQNILNCFNHDKVAGLEYADMELNDLANYERAEEIVRRQVLDYHINDKDGIMLLGDVFLEWGTEKDPEKLDLARQQYATLIQLYGSKNEYLARMMRYFVRTDNLREVLQLKENFIPKEKSLSSEDWAEMSGFLLDKLYGPLAPSEEYLRSRIEDVLKMLNRAVKLDSKNPVAMYNLARYFIETNENQASKEALKAAIDNFKDASVLHKRDIYKYIDSYRLLGEEYTKVNEFLRAQEYYTEGISLYTAEHDASGFEGTPKIGKLYADQADIDYFVSGDYDNALRNYTNSVDLENDNPSIRYRIGYIQYKNANYAEALGSFMKAGDGNAKDANLLLAMANTLSLRGDDYAAQGYYDNLITQLDEQIADRGIMMPQLRDTDYEIVSTYLNAANNYGVTLHRLAKRTGNSALNAKAIVELSQSVRAWDALTRNQNTLLRLEGSNLAAENIKYITHPISDFEPAIYTEIPRVLDNNENVN